MVQLPLLMACSSPKVMVSVRMHLAMSNCGAGSAGRADERECRLEERIGKAMWSSKVVAMCSFSFPFCAMGYDCSCDASHSKRPGRRPCLRGAVGLGQRAVGLALQVRVHAAAGRRGGRGSWFEQNSKCPRMMVRSRAR